MPTPNCWPASGQTLNPAHRPKNAALSDCCPVEGGKSASMSRTGIMQITDTLAAGGTERVAVNVANNLPRARYEVHLCTTRQDGPLARLVSEDVGRLTLSR